MTEEANEDPRDELSFLVSATRALLETLEDSGATELPTEARGPWLPAADRPPTHAQAPARSPAPSPTRSPAPSLTPSPSPSPSPSRSPSPSLTRSPSPSPSPASPVDAEARRLRLTQIDQVVQTCTRCPLHSTRTNTVFARGNPSAELMFIGEGPGAEEDAQGLPFVGKAGQLLDKMIEAMGYRPEDVYIANVVKCRPPENRKPEPNELTACVGYLHEQIALVQPKVIVALGATAIEGLLGITGITKLRGTWRLYRGQIPVMPTFHPAYLLRAPEAKREVWSDLKQVMAKLGKPPAPPRG